MVGEQTEQAVARILIEVFRLGRDFEAHTGEIHTVPGNYDGVCDYIAEETAKLTGELLGIHTAPTSIPYCPAWGGGPVVAHRPGRLEGDEI